jgi:ribosome modulation factor
MAMLIDRLKAAHEEGFTLGRARSAATCPYFPDAEQPMFEAWSEGYLEGEKQAERDDYYRRTREQAKARAEAFDEKLTALLGGSEYREAFEEWLAEFVDARTRS